MLFDIATNRKAFWNHWKQFGGSLGPCPFCFYIHALHKNDKNIPYFY